KPRTRIEMSTTLTPSLDGRSIRRATPLIGPVTVASHALILAIARTERTSSRSSLAAAPVVNARDARNGSAESISFMWVSSDGSRGEERARADQSATGRSGRQDDRLGARAIERPAA